MLDVLPPELRFKIYSYVFSTQDEGLIALRVMQRGDWVTHMGLAPYSILLQDPQYNRYRRGAKNRGVWTDPSEEAFHKALQWTCTSYNPLTMTHLRHRNAMIAEVIHEYTGRCRHGGNVSSHIDALRKISDRIPEDSSQLTQQFTQQLVCAATKLPEANWEDTANIDQILRQIQLATTILARRNSQRKIASTQRRRRQRNRNAQAPLKPQIRSDRVLPNDSSYSLIHQISHFTPQNDRELSFQLLRPLASNFLALSSVDRFSRTDVLQYIESQLSFDFTWDVNDLKAFCTHIKPTYRERVRHIAIEFVESHAPDWLTSSTTFGAYISDNLPNLKKIFLTLIPHDPVRFRQQLFDVSHWVQTDRFLSNLGDLKATVVLSLRSKDREYFESKYLGVHGWKYIGSGEALDITEWESANLVLIQVALMMGNFGLED